MKYVLLVILVFLIYIFFKRQKVCASGKVIAGHGSVKVAVVTKDNRSIFLISLAVCYAAKIRWVILSEPEITQKIFQNVLKEAIDNWPSIPKVEMMASIYNATSQFKVNLHLSNRQGWFVTNKLPLKVHSADIVTSYFFLLREIVRLLDDKESGMLKKALHTFLDKSLAHDSSLSGLRDLNAKVNDILKRLEI